MLEAKLAIAQLEAKVKDRMAKLICLDGAGLLEDDGEPGRYVFPGIVFQRCKKTTFTYSPAIKALQEEEKANGTATKNETIIAAPRRHNRRRPQSAAPKRRATWPQRPRQVKRPRQRPRSLPWRGKGYVIIFGTGDGRSQKVRCFLKYCVKCLLNVNIFFNYHVNISPFLSVFTTRRVNFERVNNRPHFRL